VDYPKTELYPKRYRSHFDNGGEMIKTSDWKWIRELIACPDCGKAFLSEKAFGIDFLKIFCEQ